MRPAETTGNQVQTVSDKADVVAILFRIEAHIDRLETKIDHTDEQIHSLVRVIDEHRPLLARAAALADPGAKVRAMLHTRRKADDGS